MTDKSVNERLRPQGEWKKVNDEYVCSVCGAYNDEVFTDVGLLPPQYCAYCGSFNSETPLYGAACCALVERTRMSATQNMVSAKCSECGHVFGWTEERPILAGLDEMALLNEFTVPRYCPDCGRKLLNGGLTVSEL